MENFADSAPGRKIIMAISGQLMILFVIIHAAGNLTIFSGGLNNYAAKLHSLPLLLWVVRLIMAAMAGLHIYYGIVLTLENRRARGEQYAVTSYLASTFSSRTMIWTGIMIGLFLIYHLLHFTFQVTGAETSASLNIDGAGLPDVAAMVTAGLKAVPVSFIYIAALTGLLLHLMHGIQSSFQTLGLSSEAASPRIRRIGITVAALLFAGYILIPLLIMTGLVNG